MSNLCSYKNYLVNGTFDEPNMTLNTFKYYNGNQVKGWIFNNGVIINNSKAWNYPIPYPCGTQACSIQKKSTISQIFTVPKAGTYSLIVLYIGRNCCDNSGSGNTLNFILNSKVIKTLTNPNVKEWSSEIIELNITTPTNNKLEIHGTSTTDRSTAIQLILTDQIQSNKTSSTSTSTSTPYVIPQFPNYTGNITIDYTGENLLVLNNSTMVKALEQCMNDINCVAVTANKSSHNTFYLKKTLGDKINNPESISYVKTSEPIITRKSESVDFNYNVSAASVYVLGNYGIAPWGRNSQFVDSTAQWIWYSQEANSNAPNNLNSPITIQYIYSNKSEIEIDAKLNIMIDNSCEVFLDSQQLKSNDNQLTAKGGWKNTWNIFPCKIKPGKNIFEFKVKNSGGPGGLLVSATTSEQTQKILFHTDQDWKFIPIPTKPITSCNLSQTGLITTIDKSFPWGSLTLNGTPTQYVNIGKTITGMGGISFGCWFRSDNNADMAKIIDFGNGQNNNIILYIKNNKLGATVLLTNKNTNKKSDNLSSPINDNKWHHIVWTIQPITNGANYTIYLDNNMISIIQGAYPINMERENCFLGKSNKNSNPNFSGALSNFVMYQKVLSVKEINNLYMSMINLNDPALYIYLPFSTNSVLDTLLNNYAGKTFSLPVTKSNVESENWTCVEEEKNKWIGVKMENGKAICMSMDGTNCIEEETEKACNVRISNPIVPSNPIICGTSQMKLSWCDIAQKQLTQPDTAKTLETKSTTNFNVGGTPIADVKPGVKALSALEINIGEKSLNLKGKKGAGQILSLKNMNDVNSLMIGGIFKLRVNLPMTPPYIKGKTFDINKGIDPNYFYLCVEKLDNNCNIKAANGKCVGTFADNKKCDIRALTSRTQSNTYRLVLVSSQYVLDPSVPIGKNSDFTLVQVNNQIYLKNVQTGYLPSIYSNENVLPVYGDMEVKSNSNVNKIYSQLNNTQCNQEIPPIQTQGTTFVKCDIKRDPGTYLITTKNIGSSSPIRVNVNKDKTISLNLLSFNTYGFPTKVYSISSCNFNIQTYTYIEKMTNALGTFMVNMICFEDTQNNKSNPKNQLKFNVELLDFPKNFVKDNSVFDIN